MRESFNFVSEDGKEGVVRFDVVEDKGAIRPYGIAAYLMLDGEEETAEARQRYITYEEAERTISMLCKYQVTPCTLCDVV